jgi:hypothetical protein
VAMIAQDGHADQVVDAVVTCTVGTARPEDLLAILQIYAAERGPNDDSPRAVSDLEQQTWTRMMGSDDLTESSPSSNMQVGGSGVALARDTHADLGRESAVLIIRHVIGRGCHIWVIEPNPASRVVNVKQPLAAARPEAHISPQRHLPVRNALAAHGRRRRPRGAQSGLRCL